MAEIAGYGGVVEYATATPAGINNWTLSYVTDALETTDFQDSGLRTYIPGLRGWSGTFSGSRDGVPLAQTALAYIELQVSTDATQLYTGSVLITNSTPTVAVDGVITISYDFTGSGALGLPTA